MCVSVREASSNKQTNRPTNAPPSLLLLLCRLRCSCCSVTASPLCPSRSCESSQIDGLLPFDQLARRRESSRLHNESLISAFRTGRVSESSLALSGGLRWKARGVGEQRSEAFQRSGEPLCQELAVAARICLLISILRSMHLSIVGLSSRPCSTVSRARWGAKPRMQSRKHCRSRWDSSTVLHTSDRFDLLTSRRY